MSEVSQICEKVIIIDKGNILAIDTPKNLEDKVSNKNILTVTVEDTKDNINEVVNKIDNIKDIKLISENSDGTKQYTIFAKDDKDIRKEISETFAKNEITILELKKTEATLEDAFLQLINNYSKEDDDKSNKKNKLNEDKQEVIKEIKTKSDKKIIEKQDEEGGKK